MSRWKNAFVLTVEAFAAFLIADTLYVHLRGLPAPERAIALMHQASIRLAQRYGCTEADLERGALTAQGHDYYMFAYHFRAAEDVSFVVIMSRDGAVDVSGSPALARYAETPHRSPHEKEKGGAGVDAALSETLCPKVK